MNIGTPRFYVDEISYLMSRGVAQNGNFDVIATNGSNGFMGTFTTGSEAELFDMNPLNKCTFDTSADTDGHVVKSIDKQRTVELVVDLESDFGVYNIDKEVTLQLSVDIKSNFSLTN